jgi:biopolymer transport protein ExbD
MKLNSKQLKASTAIFALLLMAGMTNVAMADATTATDTGTKASPDEQFRALDANKDGKISLKEAVKDKALTSQFESIDANHDGMISAEEYTSVKGASPSPSAQANPSSSKY